MNNADNAGCGFDLPRKRQPIEDITKLSLLLRSQVKPPESPLIAHPCLQLSWFQRIDGKLLVVAATGEEPGFFQPGQRLVGAGTAIDQVAYRE